MVRRLFVLLPALLTFIFVAALAPAPALADKRVALVIGNSAYRSVPRLPNPANDAAAMADLFRNAGFDDVQIANDLGVLDLRKVLRSFAAKAANVDIAVVYYAGHGIEVGGRNYLIPVDAVLASDIDIEDEAVDLDRVLQLLEPAKRLKLVILDACRSNPFAQKMQRTVASRAIGRGLGQPDIQTSNTLVAFAAKAGSFALDGDGAHSPFAAALLRHLTKPGVDLRIALGDVHDDVVQATNNGQEPYLYGAMGGGSLTLVPAKPEPPQQSKSSDLDEARDFSFAKQAGTLAAWDAFLAHHPSGFLADLAKAERQRLADAAPARRQEEQKQQGLYVLPKDAAVVAGGLGQDGHNRTVNFVAFSPDGKRIASGEMAIELWDAASGALLQTLEGNDQDVHCVAFSPDGTKIASAGNDNVAKLWDATSGALLKTFEADGHWVSSVAFSPDGKRIASGISEWDAASGTLLKTLERSGDLVLSVAFSPDGKRIASASDDHSIKLWDAATGAVLKRLGGHRDAVRSVAFSPDGRRIVSASDDHSVKLWDVARGVFMRTLEGHSDRVMSVAFSPDGKRVVSGSADTTVKLWDPTTGALLKTLKGHSGLVTSVAFSPDGKRIASGSWDGTIKLWDASSGALLATFFRNGPNWAAVAADGRYVASGDISKFLEIKRGTELLPMDEFITRNRRVSLADVLSGTR